MRKRVHAVIAAAAALVMAGATPAAAITGGTFDANNTYSNVGLIAFYDDGVRYRCSATLVTSTVLLTAAHCTYGVEGGTVVTFDNHLADAAPSGLPVAANPAKGYAASDLTAGYSYGVGRTHPEYSDFTDLANWNDVGVVVLSKPVKGIKPARLAPRNHLEKFVQPALNSTLFRIVGYGTHVVQAEDGPRKPTPETYPLQREYADAPGQKLTAQILQVNGNENDPRGTGGSCFGDSGGPSFSPDRYLVTVTSYGYTSNCRYIDGLQRVDIPVVQDWLAGFGVRPAA
jgi:Trypsin